MKLYAHSRHVYEAKGEHFFMEWGEGQVRNVPNEIGAMLLGAHSAKFCDVTNDLRPEDHRCAKSSPYERTPVYETTQLVPSDTTVLVPQEPKAQGGRVSKQKLQTRRNTFKRSRVARVNPESRGG